MNNPNQQPQKDQKDYLVAALIQQRDGALNQLAQITAQANEKVDQLQRQVEMLMKDKSAGGDDRPLRAVGE